MSRRRRTRLPVLSESSKKLAVMSDQQHEGGGVPVSSRLDAGRSRDCDASNKNWPPPCPSDQRTLSSDSLDLCSSCSATAASPLGSVVRPVSMSLTDDGDRPTSVPISDNVIPFRRRSEMREDQVQVVIGRNIRLPVIRSQRLSVTALRQNMVMARPTELPKLDSIGARIRWWRKRKHLKQNEFAAMCRLPISTLSDLENGRSKGSESLDVIAGNLGVSAHYLRTDQWIEGNFEGHAPSVAVTNLPASVKGMLPRIPEAELAGLNGIERDYLQDRMLEHLREIKDSRRQRKPGC